MLASWISEANWREDEERGAGEKLEVEMTEDFPKRELDKDKDLPCLEAELETDLPCLETELDLLP